MRRVGIACAAVFLAGWTGAAQGIKATVLAGAGGYIRADCVAPVQVILDNDEGDYRGTLYVSLEMLGSCLARAERKVNLPPHSRKAVFLFVPGVSENADHVRIQYKTASGRTLLDYREPVTPFGANVPIIGSFDRLPGSLPKQSLNEGEVRYERLSLTPEQLPDRFDGLMMYDAFILSPAPPTPLARTQVQALYEWVLRGGILIVDASKRVDSLLSDMLPHLLPFHPKELDQVRFDLFGDEVPFARGTVERGEVIVESNGCPLVIRRNMGLGAVVCFAIPPDSPAWETSIGHEGMWLNLLGPLSLNEVKQTGESYEALTAIEERQLSLMTLVQTVQQAGLRMGLVIVLIALYGFAVGPFDYLLLKRLGRPRLTWLTFPLLVAMFTLAAWYGAKIWVGGKMAVTARQRVLYLPDEGLRLRFDLASVFVPMVGDYRLHHGEGPVLLPIQSDAIGIGTSSPGTLDLDTNTLTQRIPGWQERFFAALGTAPMAGGGIALELADDGKTLHVTNNTGRTLQGGAILHGDKAWRVTGGQILTGESDVPLDRPSVNLKQFSWSIPSLMLVKAESGEETPEHWPLVRELEVRDALRRGAIILFGEDSGTTPCEFVVNGDERTDPAQRLVMALIYPRQETGVAVMPERPEDAPDKDANP